MVPFLKNILLVLFFSACSMAQILTVPNGGTGTGTLTPNGPLVGNGTGPVTAINPGVAGQCLISGGPTAPPVYAPCPSGGGGGGTGGFGFVVPTEYPTISSAIAAANAAGSGPVVVLPTSTDNTPYSNPYPPVRVQNYKKTPAGTDSMFFRDVSEWGPVDGKVITWCNTTAGSPNVLCGGVSFVNAPVSQGGDVGKLILIDGVGPQIGQVNGTMTVASTAGVTAPGPPNTEQGVIFTDATDGCNDIDHMPYAYVTLDATGMPTGNLRWSYNFYGKGCTHPPTQGTVNNVTGTVTFSGGNMVTGDLVSTIVSVTDAQNIVLADSATIAAQGAGLYGSDVHDTFQAACNSISGGMFEMGTLTFSGIGLTSHGIDCNSSGIHILGVGYNPLNSAGSGSTLVYAGKTPNNILAPQYVLNLAYGGGARVERMGIRGNSVAMPYGLMLSYGTNCESGAVPPACMTAPGSGNWINQMGHVDQVWFGFQWGDAYGYGWGFAPRLQSCIMSYGPGGNDDFWNFDRIYCMGSDVGVDAVNNQAVHYHYGQIHAQFNNIGFATFNYTEVDDYYTEYNRVDFALGSPTWQGGWPGTTIFHSYDGESSAMEFENPNHAFQYTAFSLRVDYGALGGEQYIYGRPDGVSSDYSQLLTGNIQYTQPRGKVILPYSMCGNAGAYGGMNLEFKWLAPSQIIWNGSGEDQGCRGYSSAGRLKIDYPDGPYDLHTDVPNMAGDWFINGNYPLMLDVNRSQTHVGTLYLKSPSWGSGPAQAYGTQVSAIGITGTTVYNYQFTCLDSLGGETAAAPLYGFAGQNIYQVTNGNATLDANNYNQFQSVPREGCAAFRMYGDNGVGGCIGLLTTQSVADMPNGQNINDQGQWPKDCNHTPPTHTTSGGATFEGGLNVQGLTTLNNVTINGTCTGPGCGTGGGGPASTALSALTSATAGNSIPNANYNQEWLWAKTDNGFGLHLGESAPDASGSSPAIFWSSTLVGSSAYPFYVTAQDNGSGIGAGLAVNPQGVTVAVDASGNEGNGLFEGNLQLPLALANQTSLGTDGNGKIIPGTGGGGGVAAYTAEYKDIPLSTNPGPIPLPPPCTVVNNNCVAVTPTQDTLYRLMAAVTQTQPGQSCTANGTLQFWVSYTDADGLPSGTAIANQPIAAGGLGAGTYATAMNMGFSANSAATIFNVMPLTIRVMAGTSFSYRIQQTTVAQNCTQQGTFTLRLALFAGG